MATWRVMISMISLIWMEMMECIFGYKVVSDKWTVKVAAMKLKERPSASWEQIKATRQRRGKSKVRGHGRKMKSLLKSKWSFLACRLCSHSSCDYSTSDRGIRRLKNTLKCFISCLLIMACGNPKSTWLIGLYLVWGQLSLRAWVLRQSSHFPEHLASSGCRKEGQEGQRTKWICLRLVGQPVNRAVEVHVDQTQSGHKMPERHLNHLLESKGHPLNNTRKMSDALSAMKLGTLSPNVSGTKWIWWTRGLILTRLWKWGWI